MHKVIAKLMRTRPCEGRPYKSDAMEYINPDGPEAAFYIQSLENKIDYLKAHISELEIYEQAHLRGI